MRSPTWLRMTGNRSRPLPAVTARALLLAVALSALPAVTAAPASAAPGTCRDPADPGPVIPRISWHQRWLAPERSWPVTDGSGVRVAVIDSGVDDDHPQLTGQVAAGADLTGVGDDGTVDCASHGTAVASLIAATRTDGVGFHGIAPGVTIVPIRVTERIRAQPDGSDAPAGRLAEAIDLAVASGAKVINMSLAMFRADAAVRAAVERAVRADVVLVAAVGNSHQRGTSPDPTPYPAAFDGVIGVGAIDETGVRLADSQVGDYVDLVAPGGAVVAASRVSGHAVVGGTSYATPVVSAAAALLRAAEPDLSAAEVARRLIATADPAPGGQSDGYGHGVVNPYRAVTERLTAGGPVAAPAMPTVVPDAAAAQRVARWQRLTRTAVGVAAGTALLTLLVAVTVAAVPGGRRRRWQPTRRTVDRGDEVSEDGARTGGVSATGTTGTGATDTGATGTAATATGSSLAGTDPQEAYFVVPGPAAR